MENTRLPAELSSDVISRMPKVVSDASALDPVIDQVIAENAGQAEQYRGGKQGLLGFFVGRVMKEMGGKADPRAVNERVREKLG